MHLIYIIYILIALSVSMAIGDDRYRSWDEISTTEKNRNSMLCMDIRPQHSVNIKEIMGMWYGNEVIIHSQDVPGVFNYDSCVIIHLSDMNEEMQSYNNNYGRKQYREQKQYTYTTSPYHQQQHQQHQQQPQQQNYQRNHADNDYMTQYLRLIWSESEGNLEYNFNYSSNAPGLWTNIGEQRGSMVAQNHYTQFKGSVQVVKAVSDHLVLTFCGNEISSSMYTIVLQRNPIGLGNDELRSIRGLLSRRGLSTHTIRKVCVQNSAVNLKQSLTLFATILGLFFYILKRNYI